MSTWTVDTRLSDRDVASCVAGPGERVPPLGPCSVVVVLDGSLVADGERTFVPCEVAVVPAGLLEGGPEGCRLGAVRWDGVAPSPDARIGGTASRRFERYDSFQSQLRVVDGDEDRLAPWELYRVRMTADTHERVQLHVHHVVTNLLFVPGRTGEPRGYLVESRDGRVTASPLVGGDRAIVRPELHHHVVPIASGDPVDMIVLNDAASRYEDVERSDFHLVESVPWSEVEIRERADRTPRLIEVGPG